MGQLCQLMQLAFLGKNPEHEGFGEYDLIKGIAYCEDYLEAGVVYDVVGGFDMAKFLCWCKQQLKDLKDPNKHLT